jgi:LysM repeat protein
MGRLPQPGSGKPGFNLAVITIVALHVVFFGGLLLQGCRPGAKDEEPPLLARMTNTNAFPDSLAGLGQPYPDTTNLSGLTAPGDHLSFTSPPPQAAAPTNLWVAPSRPERTPEVAAPARTEVVEPPPAPRTMTEYKVAKGDSPWTIAQKHGVTLEQLREANPDMKERALQVGQPLMIPPAARKEVASAAGKTDNEAPGVMVYQVKAGDTLTKIAKAHGTTVKAVRSLNQLKTDRIVVNQKLKLPSGGTNQTNNVKPL